MESALVDLSYDNNRGFLSVEAKLNLIKLANQRARILKEREETWRLKSHAIWLKARDENTRYFQNFSKGRKASNTIWQIPTPDGGTAKTCNQLS